MRKKQERRLAECSILSRLSQAVVGAREKGWEVNLVIADPENEPEGVSIQACSLKEGGKTLTWELNRDGVNEFQEWAELLS